MSRSSLIFWLAIGWLGFAILPWYGLEDGLWSTAWLVGYNPSEAGSGLLQGLAYGKGWLLPVGLLLLAPLLAFRLDRTDPRYGRLLIWVGALGIGWMLVQGFGIGLRGWNWRWVTELAGPLGSRQFGMGGGALLAGLSFLFMLTGGLAARGTCKGDSFVTGSIGFVIASVGLFVFFPVMRIMSAAAETKEGLLSLSELVRRLTLGEIWNLHCIVGAGSCGTAWHTLLLATLCGIFSTLLGTAFALVVVRTGFRAKRLLRMLTVLPIITPPFVIGLAVILLFGRSGAVTLFLSQHLDIAPSRWIYGLPGVLLTQVLAFTPVAFLVMIGIVQGVSPTMEEAAQTLRADAWRTFRTVTVPLIRPGLANAFLICFIESMADFGNPLVLGGNFDVLSTQIFYAIVGAQNDPGKAAALGMVLLAMTLSVFWLQRSWLGRRSYTSVGGKGDGGTHATLPRAVSGLALGVTLPWALFTAIMYVMILFGGFVENWGRDNSLSLRHYKTAFEISWSEFGIVWAGRAWNSLFTTVEIAALSAPLTAALGLLTAYLLTRQHFRAKGLFEFVTMLSFAIPGTVIGVSYIMAFNVPPIEITGTALILVICFVFRNMPVAIRAGMAAMSQIDKSLDECSLTLGAGSLTTVRRVIMPLLRPATVAALVYSFVRAITSVSAVIFLVTAQYNLATSYIVGRAEASDYGTAIAYSSVLIVLMGIGIGGIQLAVGERKLGRRASNARRLQGASA